MGAARAPPPLRAHRPNPPLSPPATGPAHPAPCGAACARRPGGRAERDASVDGACAGRPPLVTVSTAPQPLVIGLFPRCNVRYVDMPRAGGGAAIRFLQQNPQKRHNGEWAAVVLHVRAARPWERAAVAAARHKPTKAAQQSASVARPSSSYSASTTSDGSHLEPMEQMGVPRKLFNTQREREA